MITNLIVEMSPVPRPTAGPRDSGASGSFEEALQLSAPADPAEPEAGAFPAKLEADGAAAGEDGDLEPADASPEEDAAGTFLDETEVLAEDAALSGEVIPGPTNRHVLSFAGDAPAIAAPGEVASDAEAERMESHPDAEIEAIQENQPVLPLVEPEAGPDPAGAPLAPGGLATDVMKAGGMSAAGAVSTVEQVQETGAEPAAPAAGRVSAEALAPVPSDHPARAMAGPAVTDDSIRVLRRDQPAAGDTDITSLARDQRIPEPAVTRDETAPRVEPRPAAAAIPQAGSVESLDTAAADWSGRELHQKLAADTARPADPPAAPPRLASPLVRNVAGQLAGLPLEEGKIKLQLKPHGMGLIEVELIRDMAGRQEISIRVQNPMVLEALRAERGAMQNLLAEHGHSDGLQLDLFQRDGGENHDKGEEALSREAAATSLTEAEDLPAEPAARPQVINPTNIVI